MARLRARRAVDRIVEKPAEGSARRGALFKPTPEDSVVYDEIDINKPGTSLLHSGYLVPVPEYGLVSDDATPYSCAHVGEDHTVHVLCANPDEDDPDLGRGKILKPVAERVLKLQTRAVSGIILETFTGAVDKLAKNTGHEGKLIGEDGTEYRVYSNLVKIIKGADETEIELPDVFFDDEDENFHVDCMCIGADGQLVFVWSNDWRGNHSVGVLSVNDKEFVFIAELGECTVASVAIDWRGNILLLGEWMDGGDSGNPALILLDTGAENPADWNELRDLEPAPEEDGDNDDDDDNNDKADSDNKSE